MSDETPFGFGSREWLGDAPRQKRTDSRYADTDEFECPRGECDHEGPMHVYHVPAGDVWYAVCPVCDRSFEPK